MANGNHNGACRYVGASWISLKNLEPPRPLQTPRPLKPPRLLEPSEPVKLPKPIEFLKIAMSMESKDHALLFFSNGRI